MERVVNMETDTGDYAQHAACSQSRHMGKTERVKCANMPTQTPKHWVIETRTVETQTVSKGENTLNKNSESKSETEIKEINESVARLQEMIAHMSQEMTRIQTENVQALENIRQQNTETIKRTMCTLERKVQEETEEKMKEMDKKLQH